MMIVHMAAILLVAGSTKPTTSEVRVQPIATSVCELVANPTNFDGKFVRFQAQFETDYIERSLLFDKSCRGNGGLLPDVPADTPGKKALDDAIDAARPSTELDKTITATFTGIFHYSAEPEMCMFLNKETCRRYVTVTHIRDLVLMMKQKR